MRPSEVERLLGLPLTVEQKEQAFYGAYAEVMVYHRRRLSPMQYPMLWVHLREGKVEEVYAKRHGIVGSWGVYGTTKAHQWETPEFVKTFPTASQSK